MTDAIDFLEGYLKGRGDRMKAEDTVIRGEKLVPYVFKDKGGYRTPFSIAEKLAKAQAEISFKAGIKEVVDWLDKNITYPYPLGSWGYKKWHRKRKKWGIK